jgi:hypothetical protein
MNGVVGRLRDDHFVRHLNVGDWPLVSDLGFVFDDLEFVVVVDVKNVKVPLVCADEYLIFDNLDQRDCLRVGYIEDNPDNFWFYFHLTFAFNHVGGDNFGFDDLQVVFVYHENHFILFETVETAEWTFDVVLPHLDFVWRLEGWPDYWTGFITAHEEGVFVELLEVEVFGLDEVLGVGVGLVRLVDALQVEFGDVVEVEGNLHGRLVDLDHVFVADFVQLLAFRDLRGFFTHILRY